MPKQNSRPNVGQRLARRANSVDPRRLELISEILDESSSFALNKASDQPNARVALESHSKLFDLIEELKQVELPSNPQLPQRSEQAWVKFFEWVDKENSKDDSSSENHPSPSSLLSNVVAVSDTKRTCGLENSNKQPLEQLQREYSLVTKVPFKKGNNIFAVSRHLMLSTDTVINDIDLFDFIKQDVIASTMQNIVLLLHLLNEHSKGEKSYWHPYISILPSKLLQILSLNKDDISKLLTSAHFFEILNMIRAIARQYAYFFKRLHATNLPLSKNLTYEYYCWGVSIVCSRQNEIPTINRKMSLSPVVHALIPILDMCNHNGASNQASFENNHSKLVASVDLNVDEEITINYGIRSSGDFYIHNGFVPNEELCHDVLPLRASLSESDPLLVEKKGLLKVLNMPTFGKFRLIKNTYENRHKRDPHLTMFLIVNSMTKEELDTVEESDNPVGVADEIYDFVHYDKSATNGVTADQAAQSDACKGNNDMKQRLSKKVKDYLMRRSQAGIALIDRALADEIEPNTALSNLLQHEKSIYQSHLINCESS